MWIDEVRSLGHDVGKARRATPAAVRGGNHGTRAARAAWGGGAGAGNLLPLTGGCGAGGTRGAIRAPGVVTRERGAFGARLARRTRAVAGADRV